MRRGSYEMIYLHQRIFKKSQNMILIVSVLFYNKKVNRNDNIKDNVYIYCDTLFKKGREESKSYYFYPIIVY